MVDHERLYRIGPFILRHVLGRGSFAKVKLAVDEETGKRYACKIIDKSVIKQKTLSVNVQREVAVMRKLRHRNTVSLIAVYATTNRLFIVMELVEGGELFSEIQRHTRLSEPYARFYFKQLIDGLQYCHSHGIYHRDLKPDNLLVDNDRTLKITDFGLSFLKEDSKSYGSTNGSRLNTQCGTPHYAAPEIISLREGSYYSGARADIWSCGIILYQFVSGLLPFESNPDEANNHFSLYQNILTCTFNFPDYFSDDLKDLIRNLLKKEPEERYNLNHIRQHRWFKDDTIDHMPGDSPVAMLKEPTPHTHTDHHASQQSIHAQRIQAHPLTYPDASPMTHPSAHRTSTTDTHQSAALATNETKRTPELLEPHRPPMSLPRPSDSIDLSVDANIVRSELIIDSRLAGSTLGATTEETESSFCYEDGDVDASFSESAYTSGTATAQRSVSAMDVHCSDDGSDDVSESDSASESEEQTAEHAGNSMDDGETSNHVLVPTPSPSAASEQAQREPMRMSDAKATNHDAMEQSFANDTSPKASTQKSLESTNAGRSPECTSGQRQALNGRTKSLQGGSIEPRRSSQRDMTLQAERYASDKRVLSARTSSKSAPRPSLSMEAPSPIPTPHKTQNTSSEETASSFPRSPVTPVKELGDLTYPVELAPLRAPEPAPSNDTPTRPPNSKRASPEAIAAPDTAPVPRGTTVSFSSTTSEMRIPARSPKRKHVRQRAVRLQGKDHENEDSTSSDEDYENAAELRDSFGFVPARKRRGDKNNGTDDRTSIRRVCSLTDLRDGGDDSCFVASELSNESEYGCCKAKNAKHIREVEQRLWNRDAESWRAPVQSYDIGCTKTDNAAVDALRMEKMADEVRSMFRTKKNAKNGSCGTTKCIRSLVGSTHGKNNYFVRSRSHDGFMTVTVPQRKPRPASKKEIALSHSHPVVNGRSENSGGSQGTGHHDGQRTRPVRITGDRRRRERRPSRPAAVHYGNLNHGKRKYQDDKDWLRTETDRMVWCLVMKDCNTIPDEVEFGKSSVELQEGWKNKLAEEQLGHAKSFTERLVSATRYVHSSSPHQVTSKKGSRSQNYEPSNIAKERQSITPPKNDGEAIPAHSDQKTNGRRSEQFPIPIATGKVTLPDRDSQPLRDETSPRTVPPGRRDGDQPGNTKKGLTNETVSTQQAKTVRVIEDEHGNVLPCKLNSCGVGGGGANAIVNGSSLESNRESNSSQGGKCVLGVDALPDTGVGGNVEKIKNGRSTTVDDIGDFPLCQKKNVAFQVVQDSRTRSTPDKKLHGTNGTPEHLDNVLQNMNRYLKDSGGGESSGSSSDKAAGSTSSVTAKEGKGIDRPSGSHFSATAAAASNDEGASTSVGNNLVSDGGLSVGPSTNSSCATSTVGRVSGIRRSPTTVLGTLSSLGCSNEISMMRAHGVSFSTQEVPPSLSTRRLSGISDGKEKQESDEDGGRAVRREPTSTDKGTSSYNAVDGWSMQNTMYDAALQEAMVEEHHGLRSSEEITPNPFEIDIPALVWAIPPATKNPLLQLPRKLRLLKNKVLQPEDYRGRRKHEFRSLLRPPECYQAMQEVIDGCGYKIVGRHQAPSGKYKIKWEWQGKEDMVRVTTLLYSVDCSDGLSIIQFQYAKRLLTSLRSVSEAEIDTIYMKLHGLFCDKTM